MLSRAWHDDNGYMVVMLNTYMKKDIAMKAGLKSAGPINGCMNAMCEAGLVKSLGGGAYAFSPEYFGSKDWRSADSVRIVNLFDKDGVSCSTEIDYGDGPEELKMSDSFARLSEEGSSAEEVMDDPAEGEDASNE